MTPRWLLLVLILSFLVAVNAEGRPDREFDQCKSWLNQICPPLRGRLAAVKCAWLSEPSKIKGCDELVSALVAIELSQIETNAVCNMRWRCKSPLFREKNSACGAPEFERPCDEKLSIHKSRVDGFNKRHATSGLRAGYSQALLWLESD